MASLTSEQQAVCDYAVTADEGSLILIDSIAGSGKTTLLVKLAEVVKPSSGCYLAYNKSVATSSKDKFPSYIDCRTTHSLAYRATVPTMGLKVGFFNPRQIKERLPSADKNVLVEDIREFCLSSYLTYKEFAEDTSRTNAALANKYLNLMSEGKIDCTHDFYLKAYHMMLANGDIQQAPYDLLMLDEAGDLNQVTMEIFRLLPAKLKVAVGDPHQNIYMFNHTINCFDKLSSEGTTFKLSKSFRVPVRIAEPVEKFCQDYLDPDMVFEGVESTKTEIVTRGYIARTNGGLVNKMVELNNDRVPYGLVRKAQEIFKLPLMVAGMKYQGKIYDVAYKHLQDDIDDWYENVDGLKSTYKTAGLYLKKKYSEDMSLGQAINLVGKHGKSGIFDAYAEAKNHEGKKQDLMVLTTHSGKGAEFDEVILAPDMNTSIEKLVAELKADASSGKPKRVLADEERESLNLYYVACTRALVSLKNAEHLR
jgi:F-box protein 18 (helicase)